MSTNCNLVLTDLQTKGAMPINCNLKLVDNAVQIECGNSWTIDIPVNVLELLMSDELHG